MGLSKMEENEEEKWIKHYSSGHQILLVGEGDFSFSLCLAMAFGSASNICASSLDSYGTVITKYREAKSNLDTLKNLGASILHGVDATKMKRHPDLRMRKFDRIIFNFPHAGFYGKENNPDLIEMHRNLVKNFFRNASGMLRANGEVHVSHKTTPPFSKWNSRELASESSLSLIRCPEFKIEDYPGYNNKKGGGLECDNPFPLRECSTFIFGFNPAGKKKFGGMRCKGFTNKESLLPPEIPIHMPQQKITSDLLYPCTKSTAGMNGISASVSLSLTLNIRDYERERPVMFDDYFNSIWKNFGRAGNGVDYPVNESPLFDSSRHPQSSFRRHSNYLDLPLMSDIQREHIRFNDNYFNNVNETVRRVGNYVNYQHPQTSFTRYTNYLDLPLMSDIRRENARVYDDSFNNANGTLRRFGNDVSYPFCELVGSTERFMADASGRTSNGYKYLREELHRQRQLQRIGSDSCHQL